SVGIVPCCRAVKVVSALAAREGRPVVRMRAQLGSRSIIGRPGKLGGCQSRSKKKIPRKDGELSREHGLLQAGCCGAKRRRRRNSFRRRRRSRERGGGTGRSVLLRLPLQGRLGQRLGTALRRRRGDHRRGVERRAAATTAVNGGAGRDDGAGGGALI